MTAKTEPKSPTVAITRVLKGLGLVQGVDFRVAGHYENGERLYTFAYTLDRRANRVIAENADMIESLTFGTDFPFTVSVRYPGGDGRPSVSVHNSPGRLGRDRETPPTVDAPAGPVPCVVTLDISDTYAALALAELAQCDPFAAPGLTVVKERLKAALVAAGRPHLLDATAARASYDAYRSSW
jgi:hypothetical protein